MGIIGMHAIIYDQQPDATRRFFGDVLGMPAGRLTHMVLPSGETLGLYEPRHPTAIGP